MHQSDLKNFLETDELGKEPKLTISIENEFKHRKSREIDSCTTFVHYLFALSLEVSVKRGKPHKIWYGTVGYQEKGWIWLFILLISYSSYDMGHVYICHMIQVILPLKIIFFEKHIKSYMNECYEKWPEDLCLRVLFDSAYFWEK